MENSQKCKETTYKKVCYKGIYGIQITLYGNIKDKNKLIWQLFLKKRPLG